MLPSMTLPNSQVLRTDFKRETLQDWYAPAAVIIMNGSPWQIDQSHNIRNLFSDVPIIDNQVYDHEIGWINHIGAPGVRAADRFIAINKKIRQQFQDKFGISTNQIDLIYSGVNTNGVRAKELTR